MGQNDIELFHQSYGKEHFKKMIQKTFDDYYPQDYDRSAFKINEYVDIVVNEGLDTKFGVLLDISDDNVLDIKNMPWFDMGDLPVSYNINKPESQQVFLMPETQSPSQFIVRYDTWSGCFDNIKAFQQYEQVDLARVGISFDEIEETLKRASLLVEDYRGLLAKRERMKTMISAIVFAVVVLICLIIGMASGGYALIAFFIIGSVLAYVLYASILQALSNKAIRTSHFLLAVFCRAENNRYYLRQGVEMRPGYLGRWIEFHVLPEDQPMEITLANMRKRFLKESLN